MFVLLLSLDGPPKAVEKSAKSLSSASVLFTGFPKPKLPLDADVLLRPVLK